MARKSASTTIHTNDLIDRINQINKDPENSEDNESIQNSVSDNPGQSNKLSFLSKFNKEDLILVAVLFLLIDEGVEDEFLIIIITFLILSS